MTEWHLFIIYLFRFIFYLVISDKLLWPHVNHTFKQDLISDLIKI